VPPYTTTVFADPLASRLLTDEEKPAAVNLATQGRQEQELDSAQVQDLRFMVLLIAARARLAEDVIAAAVKRGVQQVVVLGAGLDTFAYRHPYEADGLRVRERLAAAGIAVPASLTFAPVDFESTNLPDGLAAAGFDASSPAAFSWLGVVQYLTDEAVYGTLDLIAGLPAGSDVVFDYTEPPEEMAPEARERTAATSASFQAMGEPMLGLSPRTLTAEAKRKGFTVCENHAGGDLLARYTTVDAELIKRRIGGYMAHLGTRPDGLGLDLRFTRKGGPGRKSCP
jgi:methyltransferase (TIGR00027 family)